MRKKIIILGICLYGAGWLRAQEIPAVLYREGEVQTADLSGRIEFHAVAKDSSAHLGFPTAVLTGGARDEILAAYGRTDTARHIRLTKSTDGGDTWQELRTDDSWTGEQYRALSLFNLGREALRKRSGVAYRGRGKSIVLFAGGNPLSISATYTDGEKWCPFYPVNSFGGFRVTGLVRLRDGRHMALFHDDGRFIYDDGQPTRLRNSAIYKSYPPDGGLTWSRPQLILKHNLYGLYDAEIVPSRRRDNSDLLIVCSDRERRVSFLAVSSDDGETWSYPEELPPLIRGDRFRIVSDKTAFYVIYRDMGTCLEDGSVNPTFGDLMLWRGDLRELSRGRWNGLKVRLGDNYPAEKTDTADLRFSDSGYASVLPLTGRRLAVIVYGRWEAEHPPYVRNFIVDTRQHRKLKRKL